MRNVWRDDFMGYWGVVMQDRGYELPRILILETVWKVGWRGVNEARSLACNAKIRSPCPSMLASVAPVCCPSGLSRQSLEVEFCEVRKALVLCKRRSYVQNGSFSLYIRNIMPLGTRLPRWRSCALWAGAMLNFAFTEFSEVRLEVVLGTSALHPRDHKHRAVGMPDHRL